MAQAPQCFLIKFRDSVWFCGYQIPTEWREGRLVILYWSDRGGNRHRFLP